MKKINLLITLLLASNLLLFSQGQPHVKIFTNFNYDISSDGGESAFKEFELKRSYLGYSYKFDEQFSTKITFDVGGNDAGSAYTAFLKIASLTWKRNKNTTITIGQTGTKNFKFMEKAWGKRYIYKSLQDQQKWASSADVGVTLDYLLSKNLSVDVQILNGEGYKKTQSSNGLMRGGLGLIYNMGDVKVRLARDMVPRSTYESINDVQTISTLAGVYKKDDLNIGGEYNIMENSGNITDNKKTGMSVYGNYRIGDNLSLFGRYDKLDSENANGEQWNISKDGTLTILGLERKIVKGVTASINIQSWKDATEENSPEAETESTIYLNLEYKF
jgi:predicted porin